MNEDALLRAQIEAIIRGEIQEGINDYLEEKDTKSSEDNSLGFVEKKEEEKELKVNIPKDEVDKLIKEYKKIKKFRKSNLGQVKKLGLLDKHGNPL